MPYFNYKHLGRLTSWTKGYTPYVYSYDDYGNRTMEGFSNESKVFYDYKYGNLLYKVRKGANVAAEYGYNADGIRTKKTVNGVETKYYLDGNKILREKGKNTISYFYGKDGLLGFRLGMDEYTYVCDSQGNVVMLFTVDGSRVAARYEYDSFGNCTVYDGNGTKRNDGDFIGNINPFRWKSFYYDAETGLYYANGSYYDPNTGLYLNALSMDETVNGAYLTRCLDRYGLMCDNLLNFTNKIYSIGDTLNPINSVSAKMLRALPSLPQWLAVSTSALSNTLSFSVYARTALYMYRYPEIIQLMKFDGFTLLPGKYTNFINGAAYGFVALDTVFDIYTNIQNNKPTGYVIGSAVYTAATGAGIVWTSGKIGAFVGTWIGGPVGVFVGGLIGLGIGAGLSWLSNLLKGEIFK